jgi:hypothetical protein
MIDVNNRPQVACRGVRKQCALGLMAALARLSRGPSHMELVIAGNQANRVFLVGRRATILGQ